MTEFPPVSACLQDYWNTQNPFNTASRDSPNGSHTHTPIQDRSLKPVNNELCECVCMTDRRLLFRERDPAVVLTPLSDAFSRQLLGNGTCSLQSHCLFSPFGSIICVFFTLWTIMITKEKSRDHNYKDEDAVGPIMLGSLWEQYFSSWWMIKRRQIVSSGILNVVWLLLIAAWVLCPN